MTKGYFCSLNCVMAYIYEHKLTESKILLAQLTKLINQTIIPSPHWLELDVFGGRKTIEQFRNKNY
jgi:hypothetical protein